MTVGSAADAAPPTRPLRILCYNIHWALGMDGKYDVERIAEVIGGRALLSRIAVDRPVPLLCAVSSPSRLATDADPAGGCVVTIVDDGSQGAITLCGSGLTGTVARAAGFLDELLASV